MNANDWALSRRGMLTATGLAGVSAAFAPAPAFAGTQQMPQSETGGISTPSDAVVATRSGRVRGYRFGPVLSFKGIPYAATSGGAARFLPPQPVSPWEATFPALAYGPTCPQGENGQWKLPEFKFLLQWDNGITGEDCLCLNVWTPSINDGEKRPVMVWLHGGGFTGGSAQELPAYDGANLAAAGEVVVVSVNHRLNTFGFLNLAHVGGDDYAQSGNAGMLDIVAALEWVRDNIAGFGGDASNVTVFGQSGGGSKVTALMSSPAARGLFHKAIVQSGGGFGRWATPEDSQRTADAVLQELGIDRFSAQAVAEIRSADIIAAAGRASAKLRAEGTAPDGDRSRTESSSRRKPARRACPPIFR